MESHSHVGALLELLRPAVWVVDGEGTVREASPGTEDLTGWPTDLVAGRPWHDVSAELEITGADVLFPSLSPAQWSEVARHECRLTTRTGAHRYVTLSVCGLPPSATAAVMVVMEDITADKRADTSLSDSERRYAALFDNLVAGVAIFNMQGEVLDCNTALSEMLGHSREDLLGRSVREFVDSETLRVLPSLDEEILQRSGLWFECPAHRCGREAFPAEVHLKVVRLGEDLLAVAHVRDITERKAAETALERARAFSDRILNTTPNLVYIYDVQEQQTVYASTTALHLLGYSDDQIASFGTGLMDELTHPEDMTRCAKGGRSVDQLANGELLEGHYRLRHASGEWRDFHARDLVFERSSDGRVKLLVGTAEDVTEQRRIEAALRQSRETAWVLLNATHDLAMLMDPEGVVIAANEAMAASLGVSVDRLVGANAFSHMPPAVAVSRRQRAREALHSGEPVRFEDERDGHFFLSTMYPIPGPEGTPQSVAVFAHNITARRHAEQAQRLATIGQLAAGLAHEFNNLLAGLMLGAETASYHRDLPGYERLTELVLRSSTRGAEICRNLMAFARPKQPRRQPMYVEEAIEGALTLARRQLEAAGIVVTRDYRSAGRRVEGDPAQLEQVFLNLVINACHAMPNGGDLRVSTAHEPATDQPGDLVVTVSDSGQGIPAEHLSRIFEPFFTTKGRLGHSEIPGSGLGLAVSHGIISSHGGTINVTSAAGVGSSFVLRFRVLDGAVEEASEPLPTFRLSPAPQPGLKALLAEDEADVRHMLTQLLAEDGYRVTAVASATEAIAVLQREEFGLVITDLLMPGGGGKAVLAYLDQQAHPPPVLIITGHAQEFTTEVSPSHLRVERLLKPFNHEELSQAIRQVLSGA